jgi:hypothetical protein
MAKAPTSDSLKNPKDSWRENSFSSRFIAAAKIDSRITANAINPAPQKVTSGNLVTLRLIEAFQNVSLETEHFLFFLWLSVIET